LSATLGLVLAAYFYAYIPMLLGIAAIAAGIVLLTAVVAGTLAVERRTEHATVKA
jgi:hypothetical protein